MSPPPLFTSIPPQLRGIRIGAPAAGSLQVAVIRSWQDAGYRPISVNTSSELERHPGLRPTLEKFGVESVVVSPPPTPSRRLRCSLIEFLGAIKSHAPHGPFAITNADILITASEGTASWVSRLAGDEQLFGQRLDVDDNADHDGHARLTPYLGGFDFFAMHRCSLDAVLPLLSPSLEIGLPWWDHFLPLALLASSCHPRLVPSTAFRHHSHGDRWRAADYCRVGIAATRHFAAALRDSLAPTDPTAWLNVYDSLVQPRMGVTPVDRWSRAIFSLKRPIRLVAARKLQLIAAANVAVLLHAAATPIAPTAGSAGPARNE